LDNLTIHKKVKKEEFTFRDSVKGINTMTIPKKKTLGVYLCVLVSYYKNMQILGGI
jgi:hypothetical protein